MPHAHREELPSPEKTQQYYVDISEDKTYAYINWKSFPLIHSFKKYCILVSSRGKASFCNSYLWNLNFLCTISLIRSLTEEGMEGGLVHEVLQELMLRETPLSCRQWLSHPEYGNPTGQGGGKRENDDHMRTFCGTGVEVSHDFLGCKRGWAAITLSVGGSQGLWWTAGHLHRSLLSRFYEVQLFQGRLHTFVYTNGRYLNNEESEINDLVKRALASRIVEDERITGRMWWL